VAESRRDGSASVGGTGASALPVVLPVTVLRARLPCLAPNEHQFQVVAQATTFADMAARVTRPADRAKGGPCEAMS
jgi:hypothetical protein